MAQMSRLLDEALELDPEGRRRWLEALSPEYQDLEPELRQALLSEDSLQLGTLPEFCQKIISGETGAQPGDRIGPYELIRQLATGGMAQVWLARRADGSLKREIALKIPSALHMRGDLAARFEREKDILAALEHPHIARLYDAGVSQKGLPFLALEYVNGRPITTWCDLSRMTVRERVRLFLQVLDAVKYAHSKGVLHRDIKPSNVLVTQEGQARLLDFGVAKLLGQDARLTQLYGRALTPEYASPEQFEDKDLNPASDIYSLGVLLFELLAGTSPYKLESEFLAKELAPGETPSKRIDPEAAQLRAATPATLSRALKEELDAIVMKAMAADPGRRYTCVHDLAQDLQAYLEGRPVQALPATWTSRVVKLVRREPIFALAALLTVLLIGTIGYELLRTSKPQVTPVAQVNSGGSAQAIVTEKSVAVLPFVDLSEKHDQEYFADGLSDVLIDRLARVPDLKVIARTSSFYFKGKTEDVRTIANKLGVAHLLEGSVRRNGTKLRITARLLRASDGAQVWSRSYVGETANLFKVQDEIARTIAIQLDASVVSGMPLFETDTQNAEALENYYRGVATVRTSATFADDERAIAFFRRAVELDPNFALAWSRLSSEILQGALAIYGHQPDAYRRMKAIPEAKVAAMRALQINPRLADAHIALARVLILGEFNLRKGQAEVDKALELEPRNEWALTWRAVLAAWQGRLATARAVINDCLALDPLNTNRYWDKSNIEYYSGNFDAALSAERRYREGNSSREENHYWRARTLFAKGEAEAALNEMSKDPDTERRDGCGWCIEALDVLGRVREADQRLARLLARHSYGNEYFIGRIYANRGQLDDAFKWFARAYDQRSDADILYLQVDPLLKSVRSDPRYADLLHRIGLDDE